MELLEDKAAMRAWSRARRAEGARVGFVPTMGYLHEGHLSLVRQAREAADVVVVSVYVNPTQFAPDEDFDVYPRDRAGDLAKLEALGCAAVFLPGGLYVPEKGPEPAHETWVTVSRLQAPMCGESRPTFFRGVATIVTKLFHIVEPDVAVFGKKDYQQWCLVQRMVRDLDFPIEVIGLPIVREADGLAMSSRNARLTATQRASALSIHRGLEHAQARVAAGERDAGALEEGIRGGIVAAGGRVDYIACADRHTLSQQTHVTRSTLLAVAAWFGDVRLIDNHEVQIPSP